jgi:hypothetical protein
VALNAEYGKIVCEGGSKVNESEWVVLAPQRGAVSVSVSGACGAGFDSRKAAQRTRGKRATSSCKAVAKHEADILRTLVANEIPT